MKLIVATFRPLLYGVQMTAAVSLALFVAFYLQLVLSDDGPGASRIVPIGRRPKPFTIGDSRHGGFLAKASFRQAGEAPGLASPV